MNPIGRSAENEYLDRINYGTVKALWWRAKLMFLGLMMMAIITVFCWCLERLISSRAVTGESKLVLGSVMKFLSVNRVLFDAG